MVGPKIGPVPGLRMSLGQLPPLLMHLQLRYGQTLYRVSKCIGTCEPLLKVALIFFFFCTSACSGVLDLCDLLSHNALIYVLKVSIFLTALEYPIIVHLS
ncbi:hypothetical protein AMTRI_Chr09g21570 [Amborella trichopoda]